MNGWLVVAAGVAVIIAVTIFQAVLENTEFESDVQALATYTPQPTEVPTATPEPEPTATPVPEPTPLPESFVATRYGESYNGQNMGCIGAGPYRSEDASILAAPPARYSEWPCGTILRVCYADRCQEVIRKDSCPGCSRNHIDLSEAGLWYLCRDKCGNLSGISVTVLYVPGGAFAPATPFDDFLVAECSHLLLPREDRDACIISALPRAPLP